MELLREIIQRLLNEARARNTWLSDMNEIMTATILGGGTGPSDIGPILGDDAIDLWNTRVQQVIDAVGEEEGADQAELQVVAGQAMADATLDWAARNGYGSIVSSHWTARPGALQGILDATDGGLATPGHPADVVAVFDGNKVLGISLKTTKSAGDIGFKNPGWGSIATELGIDPRLQNDLIRNELTMLDAETLPMSNVERKGYLRSDPALKRSADEGGRRVLEMLRDEVVSVLAAMSTNKLKDFVLETLVDASKTMNPPYIKVTAMKGGQKVKVTDPADDPMYSALMGGDITIRPVRQDSIIFFGDDGSALFQLRFKWASQMLASSVKMSVEPAAKKLSA